MRLSLCLMCVCFIRFYNLNIFILLATQGKYFFDEEGQNVGAKKCGGHLHFFMGAIFRIKMWGPSLFWTKNVYIEMAPTFCRWPPQVAPTFFEMVIQIDSCKTWYMFWYVLNYTINFSHIILKFWTSCMKKNRNVGAKNAGATYTFLWGPNLWGPLTLTRMEQKILFLHPPEVNSKDMAKLFEIGNHLEMLVKSPNAYGHPKSWLIGIFSKTCSKNAINFFFICFDVINS